MELNPLGKPSLRPFPTIETANWLWKLRWVAVTGQLLAIGVSVLGLRIPISAWPLIALVAITAATNAIFGFVLRWKKRKVESHSSPGDMSAFVTTALVLDLICLTGLLFFSGGFANPFLFFFYVNLAVAAIILRPMAAWMMTGIAIACVLFLLGDSPAIEGISFPMNSDVPFWSIRKQGFWVAFATSSCVVTYFVTMLMSELHRREQRLADSEQQRARGQRLEAMATLAAGAGHELASPLSTIAVVSKELSRNLDKIEAPASVKNDVELIRSELDRCREILARMKSSAGEAAAEQLDPVSIASLIEAISVGLRDTSRVVFETPKESASTTAVLPVQALALALRNIIQNAIDASQPPSTVRVQIRSLPKEWEIVVQDQGQGMALETLQRIGEPFFTTKEPGRGMGMGVFLSRNVFSRLGGTMVFDSRLGQGTKCTIRLPVGSSGSPQGL